QGAPKPPKVESGKENKDATALGAGLVKGVFQGLGFPDVFGKPLPEWGIWKLFAGGAGYGSNILNAIGDARARGNTADTGNVAGGVANGVAQGLGINTGGKKPDSPGSPNDAPNAAGAGYRSGDGS